MIPKSWLADHRIGSSEGDFPSWPFTTALQERFGVPNSRVFLPGNTDQSLHPIAGKSPEYNVFDAEHVNQSRRS